MLQQIRDRITGGFAAVFLGAIAVVFVFWGIDFQSRGASYAAEVNGQQISVDEVRREWQQQFGRLQELLRDVPEDIKKQQQRMLMDRYVRQALLVQRARKLGYNISDRELLQNLAEIPEFQDNGKFSKERYDELLERAGLGQAKFEQEQRERLLGSLLQKAVVDTAFVVPYELEQRFKLEQQQREVDYMLILASAFNDQVQVTDAMVQQYYDGHKTDFQIPETLDLEYLEITRAGVESKVEVTEAGLRDYYESVKARYTTSERRRGRQILLTADAGQDDNAIKKKADDLVAKAKEPGTDFAKLSRENSTDPGIAETGGEVEWQTADGSVPEFSQVFFSMKPNEVRGPVKTQFGYHIIKLDEIEAGRVRPFEEVRAELEPEFRKERSDSVFYDENTALGEKSFAALTELASVAKDMKLELRKETGFTRANGGPTLGKDEGLIDAVFNEDVLERGRNSALVNLGDNRTLVLRVANRTPASTKPLAEVRPIIEAQVRAQAARDLAAKQGNEALTKLKGGATWESVASELKLAPAGRRWVSRDDAIAPQKVLQAAFNAPTTQVVETKPYFGSTKTDDGSFAVYSVSQIKLGDPTKETEQQRTARSTGTVDAIANYEFGAYMSAMEANAKIRRNDEKVFED